MDPGPQDGVDIDVVVSGATVNVDRLTVLVGEEPHHLSGLSFELVYGEGTGLDDLQLAPRVLAVLEESEAKFVLARPLDREPPVTEGCQVGVNGALGDTELVCKLRNTRAVELSKQFDEVEQSLVGIDSFPVRWVGSIP
jgi:hypothetical protein